MQLALPWRDRNRRFSWLKAGTFALMFVPAIWLIDQVATGSIKSILQNGLDRAFAKSTTPDASPIRHANIRRRGYYH